MSSKKPASKVTGKAAASKPAPSRPKAGTKTVTKTTGSGGGTGASQKTKPAAAGGGGGGGAGGGATATACTTATPAAPPKPEALPEVEIGLKELMTVMGDAKGTIKESGRWPMVVEENGRVMVFIHHRDCNTLNALDQLQMAPEMIRKALLGAIRYGKPMVIDLVESGDISIVKDRFDDVMPDLFELVLTKKILEDDRYMKLVKPNDDADFKHLFAVQQGFLFLFVTSNPTPTEYTKGKVLVYRVV